MLLEEYVKHFDWGLVHNSMNTFGERTGIGIIYFTKIVEVPMWNRDGPEFIAYVLVRVCIYNCCLVAKLCLTLCNPMECSQPGSSVHGILQARILEWVAILFSRGSSWPRDQSRVSCIAGEFFTLWATSETLKSKRKCSSLSHVQLFATLWTVTSQAPLSMEFSR